MIVVISMHLLILSIIFSAALSKDFSIIAHLLHNRRCFTQGLQYYDDKLYESCGLYRQSFLQQVNPVSGKVEQRKTLATNIFGLIYNFNTCI